MSGARAVVVTALAAGTSGTLTLVIRQTSLSRPRMVHLLDGALGGAVAAAAGASLVAPWIGVVLGAVAAFVVIGTSALVERALKVGVLSGLFFSCSTTD